MADRIVVVERRRGGCLQTGCAIFILALALLWLFNEQARQRLGPPPVTRSLETAPPPARSPAPAP